ncbi:MAG: AAA family ATPase [Oscillospiraceae bacterium]|jgi:wobble nucleotide-excising tRNase|nr:AAA family ATPase [Oscillospiraceae bacterium]
MIVRINKINQIGRFSNFNSGGSVAIGNLTDNKKISVIYGENTYGKSTIADILKSATSDNPMHIVNRRSLPLESSLPQIVKISYKESATSNEEGIEYNSGIWSSDSLKGKLMIFDQEFISNNIFTGVNITRNNKENLTDFILGEEGARIGLEIESRKKAAGLFPKDLKTLRPDYVKVVSEDKEVINFINLNITESPEVLIKMITEQKKLIERLDKITDFCKLPLIDIENDNYLKQFTQLREALIKISNSSYDDISSEIMKQVQKQFDNTDGSWLEKGTKLIIDDICPFCTQETKAVKVLIDAYKAIFNDKYDSYVNTLNDTILSVNTLTTNLSSAVISSKIENIIISIKKYSPFIEELSDLIVILDDELEKLRVEETLLRENISNYLLPQVHHFLSDKRANLHKKISLPLDFDEINKHLIPSDDILDTVYYLMIKCIDIIKEKRNEVTKWTPEVVTEKKQTANNSISSLEMKSKRLAQDGQCNNYSKALREQKSYKDETARLQAQLETQQSGYLNRLFASINNWFTTLGSNNFKMKCVQSTKGNKTVYELKVQYSNTPIKDDNLSKVFSESDRRSLALAIFFARAEEADIATTILVLDDPVVSFDDNRVKKTCDEIKALSSRFKQIIILTHYKMLVRQLLNCKSNSVYSKITRTPSSFVLEPFDTSDYLLSDHEKSYLSMVSFINGISSDIGIILELRPFLERHIDLLYQPELLDLELSFATLNEKITGLGNANILDGKLVEKLHNLRETLNSDHHDYIGNTTLEETRDYIKSTLDFLYSDL